MKKQRLFLPILYLFLIVVLEPALSFGSEGDEAKQSISESKAHELKPSLKFKTLEAFGKEIKEPAILLNSEHVCFFAPKRKEKEAATVFQYLVAAYNELYLIVGVHTEYKIAVYAFPKGNPHGWGGTSLCSIEYDESNLDLEQCPEWTKYHRPHVSGYIEEMAHSFVATTKAQFGWEMVGWSLGVKVSQKIAGNPILSAQIQETRQKQQETVRRYANSEFALPQDIPGNKVDRIHAWLLWQCEREYGPNFWKDCFQEIRRQQKALKDAVHLGDQDEIRNARYQITVDCFDRLPGLNFKERLRNLNISLKTDIKSLHPQEADWNRRLTE